ncbi:very long-chain-fatty-acid--CoA ligase bubblegum-like [Pollicipes pollicipes]|uniref:very long-chain-fatty-acid--CoA ligase bubblegum-like n=1 Tax=Pollicipes pollicipes TaxID=41117 RepID=UPI001884A39A|nr:very long-chain-fatty-acid--CoA ligase bubblegum-like [Pollicipes pollicipes]
MAATTATANSSVITGTRIAINVHYDQSDSATTPVIRSEQAFQSASSSGSTSSTPSSAASTPSAHTKSTSSPGELVTRLDQQLKEAVRARRDSPEPVQTAPPELPPANGTQYTDGPDQVVPTENLQTTDRFGAVKLKVGAKGASSAPPTSIHSLLRRAANRFGHLTALRSKRDGVWQSLTYKAYLDQVQCVARAFIKLGLEPKGSVCILGFNSTEWFVSSLAAIYAGGLSAGVYTTNNTEACFHCASDSHCNIFVVEDEKQLAKVQQFRAKVPSLRAVVQLFGEPTAPGVVSWARLLELGAREDGEELERRIRQVAVNQAAALIYTSGTTGPPKGVMLSHDNVTFTALNVIAQFDLREGQEHLVSYLPLSHVAAMIADIYLPLACGGTVWFADKSALKGTLGQTLCEARPTAFIGVPRVFEKIKEGFETKAGQSKGLRRSLLDWALERGRRSQNNRIKGFSSKPLGYGLARRLVLGKIHRLVGLDRARIIYSAAAPLSKETLGFFHSLDMPLLQLYGMSECTGPHSACMLDADRVGSVGPTVDGYCTRLDRVDAEGQGEICMGGRHVFMGYLNLPDKTEEAVDANGWLHSGDLGVVDDRGLISITGRSKELIITAGGENIPPVLIEDEVMKELPIISNCCLIGDKRKFLSMLLTLKVVVDLDTMEPTDQLSPPALEFCRAAGSSARTVQDVLEGPDDKVMTAIQRGLDRANSRAASGAQRVQKWTVLPVDFSIPGGEIGPTMKMKRPVIHKKYSQVIERLYA